MHDISFFTHVSQCYHAFFQHVELPCPLWNEASSLLISITGNGRAGGAGISLGMD